MEGISGVTDRMAQIQLRMASLAAMTASRTATTGTTATTGANFASVYAQAVGGQLNAEGIPTDLAAYGNGKIPATALKGIGGTGHKLWAPAASQLESLMTAASRDGVTIGITDSYRSYDEQVDLARRKGLYSQGGLAAKPGTSEHGWGMATDLDLNSKAQAWMRANGEKYGFVENVPREPWHWAYKPKT